MLSYGCVNHAAQLRLRCAVLCCAVCGLTTLQMCP